MVIPDYLSDVAKEMRAKSTSIRRDFATHRLSAGENREGIVREFLTAHLPKRFGISSGLVVSHEGIFSNQADVLIVGALNNVPLYGTSLNQLWTVESVFALIEVKTNLGPAELRDAIAKGRRFKQLRRQYFDVGNTQRLKDSLFIIWAFDCPEAETLKKNLLTELSGIPRSEQPDFIIVPDKLVVSGGEFLELSRIGRPGSSHRAELHATFGPDLSSLVPAAVVADCGENSLMAWYLWLYSWLMQAGNRCAALPSYLPPETLFGKLV
ncbi:DUF6602 domain-containing protein [Ensifer sp. 2YAB10]|uniref:DUF6602 domain-containing protein n=1 Tax=Ensifer sp. 2YAB10 TaxID=3233021 RepID=UPI003F924001